MYKRNFLIVFFLVFLLEFTVARKHQLKIKNDRRRYIALSTFGFYNGGVLDVNLVRFRPDPFRETDTFGFSLDRTLSGAVNPYLDSHQDKCLLEDKIEQYPNGAVAYFKMDFKAKQLRILCSPEFSHLHIFKNISEVPENNIYRQKREVGLPTAEQPVKEPNVESKHTQEAVSKIAESPPVKKVSIPGTTCKDAILPLHKEVNEGLSYFSAKFLIWITTKEDEGLYNLYFHSCPNYNHTTSTTINFMIKVTEENVNNFLSAGEMPLPALYFMMSLLFFLSGCFWVFILSKSRHPVFKIHYLMALLVYLKSLSLLFHGINYHYIESEGQHIAAWAILFYITHLLKGAVLFIVIVLVGTGWTFIKHILSEKDKKIFMIVIPLQVLANVAKIIIEESEEGDLEHSTWKDIFILVDLLCCGAILFPVVWSIRHLQEASNTDGKAAINLRKLKLFRHFYIMIVCYIYFTRIIVYLLRITVPFQYEWLDEMFREMATYAFFVLTGYKFRPASANPYFQVNTDDDDDDKYSIVITESGLTEGLKKVNRIETSINDLDEENEELISKRESSHEYD